MSADGFYPAVMELQTHTHTQSTHAHTGKWSNIILVVQTETLPLLFRHSRLLALQPRQPKRAQLKTIKHSELTLTGPDDNTILMHCGMHRPVWLQPLLYIQDSVFVSGIHRCFDLCASNSVKKKKNVLKVFVYHIKEPGFV